MHVVSKYKHLAFIPTDTQKGTAENWVGAEQVWEGYSAAIQTRTSVCSGDLMAHRAGTRLTSEHPWRRWSWSAGDSAQATRRTSHSERAPGWVHVLG